MRRIRRIYDKGGKLPYSQLGEFTGDLVDTITPVNEYGVKNDIAAVGSGALKGAGAGATLGTSILPGIGTAIGAGIGGIAGGISGAFGNNKAKKLQQDIIFQKNYADTQRSNAIIRNSDLIGSNSNQIYAKYGGAIPIKYINGGNLKELSEENEQVEGNSHSEGGVKLSPEVEVEGGETLNTSGNQPFVFSEKLGFAKLHKPIARAIGKLEKKVPNNITNDTIKLLKQKEEALKQQQEQFKESLGLKGVSDYELGGRIKKYSPFQDNIREYINMDNHIYKLPKRK